MGMYDEIKFRVDLPFEFEHDHRDHWFQTKSLDCLCEFYEVREDKRLWKRATGENWKLDSDYAPCELTGGITFYTFVDEVGEQGIVRKSYPDRGWVEFSAYFVKGELIRVDLVHYREPAKESAQ